MLPSEQEYYLKLIDRLCSLPDETEWVEYKMNNSDPQMLGEYISALSNSEAIEGKEKGYVLWGINNETHEVEGTSFSPGQTKVGGQELVNWLMYLTSPSLNIEFKEIMTANGKVVVLIIPRASTLPVSFEAIAAFLRLIRICEERGSGFDRIEEGMSENKIPAPKVEATEGFTRTKLYWYPNMNGWKKEDKVRTCYFATCYYYVNEIEVSNAVLRERFGIDTKNMAVVSRIIKDTLDAGYIKLSDENAAPKMRRYIPYWA